MISVLFFRGAGVSLTFEVGGLVGQWFTVMLPETRVMLPEIHSHVA